MSNLFATSQTLYSDFDVEVMVEDTLFALRRAFGAEAESIRPEDLTPTVGWNENPIYKADDETKQANNERTKARRVAERTKARQDVEAQMIADFNRAKKQAKARDAWLQREVQR